MITYFEALADAVTFKNANPGSVLGYDGAGAIVYTDSDITVLPYLPITMDAGILKSLLLSDGLLTSVDAYVATQSEVVQTLWNNAAPLTSNSKMIAAWAAQCSPPLTQADIDSYFIRAVELQATL